MSRAARVSTILLWSLLCVGSANAADSTTVLDPPHDGDTIVAGKMKTGTACALTLLINGAAVSLAKSSCRSDGTFEIVLEDGAQLHANQTIQVKPKTGVVSARVDVAPVDSPTTLDPAREGAMTVTGTMKSGAPCDLTLLVNGTVVSHGPLICTDGKFKISLTTKLAANQTIVVKPKQGRVSKPEVVAAIEIPTLVNSVKVGDAEITGMIFVDASTGTGDACSLTLTINGIPVKGTTATCDSERKFKLELPANTVLLANQTLQVTAQGGTPSKPVTIAEVNLPTSMDPAHDGDTTVTGAIYAVELIKKCDLSLSIDEKAAAGTKATCDANGKFKITLAADTKLAAKQKIQVTPKNGVASPVVTVSSSIDRAISINIPNDGDKTIRGTLQNDGTCDLIVSVDGKAIAGITVTCDAGKFTIKLPDSQALKGSQAVVVASKNGATSGSVQVADAEVAILIEEAHQDDTTVTGVTHDKSCALTLTINDVAVKDMTAECKDNGHFTITLSKQKLAINQLVEVKSGDGSTPGRTTVLALALVAPRVAEPKEGDKTVTGSADSTVDHVLVTIQDHNDAFVEQKTVEVDATSRVFIAGLTRALAEDDKVTVAGVVQATKAKSAERSVQVASAEYNWGRVRAYFSLGAISSKNDDGFSKIRPYVSLNVDKTWFNKVTCYDADPPKRSLDELPGIKWRELLDSKEKEAIEKKMRVDAEKEAKREINRVLYNSSEYEDTRSRCYQRDPFRQARWFMQLNTFFEARLQNANSLAISDVNAAHLKDGARVAAFEMGAYFPISHARTGWRFNGQRQVLFFAPLVKGGLETVPVTQIDAGKVGLDSNDIFKFMSGGLRVGHYRAFRNSNAVAPELISWIDFTVGRWDRLLRGTVAPKSVPMRFEATGRMKIPYSPFTIGFRANAGPGADEFTLFVGTRFDLSRLLSKLAPNVK